MCPHGYSDSIPGCFSIAIMMTLALSYARGSPIMGPVGVRQLCAMLKREEINESTLTRAVADNDNHGWLPLRKRTALLMAVLLNTNRSQSPSRSGVTRQGSLVAKCLRVLLSCCRACPATNSNGAVVWPLSTSIKAVIWRRLPDTLCKCSLPPSSTSKSQHKMTLHRTCPQQTKCPR